MKKCFEDLLEDLDNVFLPRDIDSFKKIKTSLKIGQRIYWYYKEDLDYFKDIGELDIKEYLGELHSGICVLMDGEENRGGEISYEKIIIVIDYYPSEKEYPQSTWITFGRLLDNENLVEIFSKEER